MSNPMRILCFILPTLFWGGSFLGIGVAVKHLPPFWAAFIRVFVAFIAITIYLLFERLKIARNASERGRLHPALPVEGATRAPIIERPKVWLQSMGTGLFSMGIPWLFLFWGEKHVTPAMAAILNGTTPIFTTLFMCFITPEEKPGLNKWLGVLIGFAGLSIIFGPELSFDFSKHLQGLFAILLMAVCYGISVLWTRRISQRVRGPINLFYQCLGGGSLLLVSSLFFELPHQPLEWSWPAYSALLYLGLFSTGIAWLAFFRLIREVGSIQASAVTYCIPLIALVLDFFFWDKWIALHQALGAGVILLGVFMINRTEATRM